MDRFSLGFSSWILRRRGRGFYDPYLLDLTNFEGVLTLFFLFSCWVFLFFFFLLLPFAFFFFFSLTICFPHPLLPVQYFLSVLLLLPHTLTEHFLSSWVSGLQGKGEWSVVVEKKISPPFSLLLVFILLLKCDGLFGFRLDVFLSWFCSIQNRFYLIFPSQLF